MSNREIANKVIEDDRSSGGYAVRELELIDFIEQALDNKDKLLHKLGVEYELTKINFTDYAEDANADIAAIHEAVEFLQRTLRCQPDFITRLGTSENDRVLIQAKKVANQLMKYIKKRIPIAKDQEEENA